MPRCCHAVILREKPGVLPAFALQKFGRNKGSGVHTPSNCSSKLFYKIPSDTGLMRDLFYPASADEEQREADLTLPRDSTSQRAFSRLAAAGAGDSLSGPANSGYGLRRAASGLERM